MADVGKIAETLRQGSTGVDGALGAVERAGKHAEKVAAEANSAGFRRIAAGIGEVGAALKRTHQELAAQGRTIAEAAQRVAAVPDDASPEHVESSLGPIGKTAGDVPPQMQAISAQVDRLQATVAQVLRGGTPGPLLGLLEEIKKPLTGVVSAADTARKQVDETIGRARATGKG
jgi:hypothetical protein